MVKWGELMVTEQTIYTINNETEFTIYNVGDETINPRQHALVVTFIGASTNLTITNSTTGEEWSYTGATTSTDVIRLDGVRSTKNSLTILRDTNRKLITLAEGANAFVIAGASGSFVLTFEFRFKTL
jgi:hypothetical protein